MTETNPTRDPLPPPFPVGTRLRCLEHHDAYVACVDRPREIKDHPEDWVRVSGRGIEVTIDEVRPGRRGTGRQLRDEDGLMFYDDGEPMLDETKDGYSVYHVVRGTSRAAKNSGRVIWPDSAHDWEVLPTPLKLRAGDFFAERNTVEDFGIVLSAGPKAFDVIWVGGSTTRYRHGVRDLRLVPSAELDPVTRRHLLEEFEKAQSERKAGARIRRGTVSPRR